MKILTAFLLGAIVAFGSALTSEAQIRTGTREAGFSLSYDDNDARRWNLGGYYGYFYNKNLQFLGIGEIQGGSGVSTTGELGGGFNWHFIGATQENFVPYAGASYLLGIGSGIPDMLGPHVGLKQFVTRNVAIRYEVGYGWDPSDTSDSKVRGRVGLSLFF